MKRAFLISLFLTGCTQSPPTPAASESPAAATASTCPDSPTGSLTVNQVKAIALNAKDTLESGMVKASESVGYSFESKGNERFNYTTKSDLCVWIFSPDNKILKGTQLTQKGKYTLQVSVPKGASSFEMAMRLEPPQPPSPSPKPSESAVPIAAQKTTPRSVQESSERISFAKNSTEGSIQDSIKASQLKHYLLGCGSGQTMTVRSNGAVNIRVVDPQGNTIGRMSNGDPNWRGNLPSDGDYTLDVTSSNDATFSIKVEVL